MKQCPLCSRTYPDDLSYCLDDGAVLLAYRDPEVTLVASQRVPTAQPATQRQGWTILGVIGVVVIVVVWGGLKLALWSAERQSHTAEVSNSTSPLATTASPSPATDPLCLVYKNCPSPTPSPTVTARNSPTPSPSPTATETSETLLSAGTYQCVLTQPLNEAGIQTTRTLKLQFTFNSDGSYSAQGYVSIQATGLSDQLYLETKGTYLQSHGVLMFRDRLERKLDIESNSWQPWQVPSGGSKAQDRIQNVTPATFQLDIGNQHSWVTFSRL
jgi:hypothetical protein